MALFKRNDDLPTLLKRVDARDWKDVAEKKAILEALGGMGDLRGDDYVRLLLSPDGDVARFADGWQTHSLRPEVFAEYWDTIRRYTRDEGRDPDGLGNCYYHNIHVNEDREAALAETKRFLDLYYSIDYTRARIEAWTALGSPEECAENLRRFRGTGMQRITLRLTAWDQAGQLERVIREVLPRVNR